MSTKELTTQIRRLKRLQAKLEELQAEISTIQNGIKAEMTAQNLEELKAGEYKIRFTTVTSNRFDTAAFKRTYSDLYTQYSKPVTSRRFSVA